MTGDGPECLEVAAGERGSRGAQRIGLVLGPALFLGFLLWPDIGLDPLQRRAAATTALVATLWITVALPVGATSILPAVLLPFLGVMTAGDVAKAFMHDLVLLFLGAFIVALGLERWGVHRRMALGVVSVVGTRPRALVLGFMAAAAFLSMWINNTATTLMMLPIGMAVISAVAPGEELAGAEHRTPFAVALLLGIAYSSSMGGVATPVGTAPNQVLLGLYGAGFPDAPEIGFGPWLVAWLPLTVLFVGVAWLVLTRFALKVSADSRAGGEAIAAARRALGPMGRGERWMAVIFGLTALLWVTRADLSIGEVSLPGWSRLVGGAPEAERWVSDTTVALGMAIVCFLVPVDRARGVFLMDWKTASRLPWDVLLLIGSGFCLAASFRATGLDDVLGSGLAPLVDGMPSWLVVATIVLAVTFLTEVTSNTATTNVLLPILAQAAVGSGTHPLLFMAPATIAASAAFMLPVATPPNAVVYGSRAVPIPTMARVGFWLNLVSIVLITIVFEVWVRHVWDVGGGLPEWATP